VKCASQCQGTTTVTIPALPADEKSRSGRANRFGEHTLRGVPAGSVELPDKVQDALSATCKACDKAAQHSFTGTMTVNRKISRCDELRSNLANAGDPMDSLLANCRQQTCQPRLPHKTILR